MPTDESRKLPVFATGELVKDYGLLFKYWEVGGERAQEALLKNEDFHFLRRLVELEGVSTLAELLDRLVNYFLPRVDGEAAVRAYKEYYGYSVDAFTARVQVARILAGWLVEAGSQWKIIRLRGVLPKD